MTPTQLSLRHLRRSWPLVAVTERWNPHARIRQDLFGFVDILAVDGNYVLAVQTTTKKNARARIRKIEETPSSLVWRASTNRKLQVHGWYKVGNRWKVEVYEM